MSRTAPVVLLVVLLTACGGPSSTSHVSPSSGVGTGPSPSSATSPTPQSLEGPYGVLVTPVTSATYTISLVTAMGSVAASAQASGLPALTCAGVANAALPLPVSTSNSRAYFMDAKGIVRFLTPQGETATAAQVPIGGSRRSMFAVSPDDRRIAVVVSDFSAGKAAIKLYVEDLNGGGHHVQIYTQTGSSSLWPVGWHGGSLVLAKAPSCTQGGAAFCCGPQEFHLVDPATALRRFTVGGPKCVPAGAASPAGVVCEDPSAFLTATVLDWTAIKKRTFAIKGPQMALLSPRGNLVALTTGSETAIEGTDVTFPGIGACVWIDDAHFLAGGDPAQVGEYPTGAKFQAAAGGECAGRIPGGL